MKDELLIKFLDGNASPVEEQLIMNELSQDDCSVSDWLQMANAARLAGSAPLGMPLEEGERIIREKMNADKKRIKWPFYVVSLAVAASVAITVIVFRNGTTSSPAPEDLMAEQIVPESIEQPTEEPNITIIEENQEAAAEIKQEKTQTPVRNELKINESSHASSAEVGQAETKMDSANKDVATADVFRMIKPAKSPYRVRVKDLGNQFIFEWEAEGAKSISMSIKDKTGNVLFEKTLTGEIGTNLPVALTEITDKGELLWTMAAEFEGGQRKVASGNIEFVYVTE